MKKLMRLLLVVVVLLIVGVGVLYFYRNSLIRSAVETNANSSLGVKTTLGSANLAPFGGTLALGNFKIGSPTGYTAEQMFTLGELGLGVNYSDLRKDPVRVNKITIDKPKAVLEYVNGKFNFQALMDQIPPSKSEPVKLIIDELTVKDAMVEVHAPMLPNAITVNIPTVVLKQIGTGEGNQNGAAIKDVVGAVMSALAASAANSPQLKDFSQLNQILKDQAQQAMAKAQKELGQQISVITQQVNGQVEKVLGPDAGKMIQGVTGGKDPAKIIEDKLNLNGLIPGEKKKDKDKK
ncbi:MAG: putative protein involved in outer rane biosis [Phycisphaerales bacterium]|nr:putative protein involved in outer rane biosis [Phycisphaerales bacterium]